MGFEVDIPADWVEYIFSDAIEINPKRLLRKGETAPFIEMKALNPNYRIVEKIDKRLFKGGGSKFKNGDTLFARITPCLEHGKIAYINKLELEQVGHGSTEFIVMSGKEGVTDNLFVYYLSRWDEVRNFAIKNMTGTSGRQRVPNDIFIQKKIRVPNVTEQQKIASILSALDDKIELNYQMNRTLEEMAQAIFKSWFVDFEPFRDGEFEYNEELNKEIPKGWKVKRLSEIAEVNQGKTPKAMDYADEGHKIIKHGDISNNGWIDWYRKERGFVKDEIDNSKLRYVLPGDILISNSSHAGAEHLVAVKRTVVHFIPYNYDTIYFTGELTSIRPTIYVSTPYIHQFFISDDGENQIRYHQRGMHLTVGETRKISILVPSENIMAEFDSAVGPLYQQIGNNIREIIKLTDLRDTLLPKLLSGKIRVNTYKDTEVVA